jgi:hypothetical protein
MPTLRDAHSSMSALRRRPLFDIYFGIHFNSIAHSSTCLPHCFHCRYIPDTKSNLGPLPTLERKIGVLHILPLNSKFSLDSGSSI